MKDSELQIDRRCHVLYSKPCKKEILAKIVLHYPEAERETVPYHREMLEAMRRHDCKGAEEAFGKIVEADSRALEMEGLAKEQVVS